MYDRDEIGNAVTATKTRYMMLYSALVAGLSGLLVTALVNPTGSYVGAAFGACLGMGTFYGLMLSVVQVRLPRLILVSFTLQYGLGRREWGDTNDC